MVVPEMPTEFPNWSPVVAAGLVRVVVGLVGKPLPVSV
jgi:hypothetical protein